MSEPEPADTTRDKKNVGKRKSLKQILKNCQILVAIRTHSAHIREGLDPYIAHIRTYAPHPACNFAPSAHIPHISLR